MHLPSTLPPYARMVCDRRARWRRHLLDRLFRHTAKRDMSAHADIPTLRARQHKFDARFGRVEPQLQRSAVDCAGVEAEWIALPDSRAERVILYLHGGAFMFRFPKTHAAMVGRWCQRLGARALMVDYRLAPEHPWPAAPADCHAAYRWLLAQGIEPRNIVIGGDSAGANLALATLHRIKAAGEPMPACAVLLSPIVDFTLSGPSIVSNERRDPIFTVAGLVALRGHYAPPEQFLDPDVSPLFADFQGLPPLLFQASESEMLRDDSMRAAAKAHACGVAVELELWEGLPHVFQALPTLPQAHAALDSIVRFIDARTDWHS